MLAKGVISGMIVGACLGATTTLVLSLKYGEPGWTKRDKVCISLSGLAIGFWIYFQESNFGIAFSLLALTIAAWPTYVSAWHKPGNEDKKGWILFSLSSLLGVLAIPRLTFAEAAPPIVFLTLDTIVLILLFVKPWLTEQPFLSIDLGREGVKTIRTFRDIDRRRRP